MGVRSPNPLTQGECPRQPGRRAGTDLCRCPGLRSGGPALGLILCCHVLKFLKSLNGGPRFSRCKGPREQRSRSPGSFPLL